MTLSDAFSEDENSSQQDPSDETYKMGFSNLSSRMPRGGPDEIWSFEGNGSLLISDPDLGIRFGYLVH